ncbi:MAG: Riboflavin synthase [Syntrophaceae bacterium PtaU1.Bin231]|nr:MAG: Riboflavin synthase [Syntrophaceae bacterium PtaU1.Bin231]
MFTGIVQGTGTVSRLSRKGDDAVLEIDTALDLTDVKTGDSIAVSGACLTVTALRGSTFAADVSAETLSRTTLGKASAGTAVNLEKSLRLSDLLGGHLVLGHVDTVGTLVDQQRRSASTVLGISVAPEWMRYAAEKGSVAVDGISLTVNRCEKDRFYVTIIPQTAGATTLRFRKPGDALNVETDILAKYVEKLLAAPVTPDGAGPRKDLDIDFLAKHGFLR